MIGSTGVAERSWLPLPAESVVTIGLADHRISIMPLVTE